MALFLDKRIEYSSNLPIYKGVNVEAEANTSKETWYIWKYTWDSTDCVRIQGPQIGAWNLRASLDW